MYDLLIQAPLAIPVTGPGELIEDAAVAVTDGRIAFVGPASELPSDEAREQVALHHHVLAPGLVNAHGHAAMTLLRGLADDAALQAWLREHIWPLEGRFANADFVRCGTELAIAEMLSTGTTTFSDMYFFPEVAADVAIAAGMRIQVAFPVAPAAGRWAATLEECLHKGLALFDRYRSEPLAHVAFGPHAVYSVDDDNLARVLTYANELDAPIHIHLQENSAEIDECIAMRGERPLETLSRLGLVGPNLQAVHCTVLSDDDIGVLADAGASVIHCPVSNLKLASGIARTSDLINAGVNVAVGTDGAASNNTLDLFAETRQANLLSRSGAVSGGALSTYQSLHMATQGGADALGIGSEVGSLELGKWADLIAIDVAMPQTMPLYDPVSQLIHTSAGRSVSDVWIAGARKLRAGQHTGFDLGKLATAVRGFQHDIATADHHPEYNAT